MLKGYGRNWSRGRLRCYIFIFYLSWSQGRLWGCQMAQGGSNQFNISSWRGPSVWEGSAVKSNGKIRREHSYLVKSTVSARETCRESRGREEGMVGERVRVTEKWRKKSKRGDKHDEVTGVVLAKTLTRHKDKEKCSESKSSAVFDLPHYKTTPFLWLLHLLSLTSQFHSLITIIRQPGSILHCSQLPIILSELLGQ